MLIILDLFDHDLDDFVELVVHLNDVWFEYHHIVFSICHEFRILENKKGITSF